MPLTKLNARSSSARTSTRLPPKRLGQPPGRGGKAADGLSQHLPQRSR